MKKSKPEKKKQKSVKAECSKKDWICIDCGKLFEKCKCKERA